MRFLILPVFAILLNLSTKARTLSDTTGHNKQDTTYDVLDWLSTHGFSIRKGFTPSTTDNTSPASAFWYKDLETKFHYTLVDFGVQHKGVELFQKSITNTLSLYPTFEWHKDGDTSSANKNNKNTLSVGGNLQWMHAISPVCFPFINGSVSYKHDYLKKLETLNYSGYLSLFCVKPWLPGSMSTRYPKTHQIIFRYYPYTGIESYNSTKTSSLSSSYWANRLTFELAPLPKHVTIAFDYTYRVKLSDNLYRQGNVYWLTTSFNYYFDSKNRIGFGIEYNKGYDPNNSFTKTEKVDLGFKLKI